MKVDIFDTLLDKALSAVSDLGFAEDLLNEWLELHDSPCRFDHHGYCQEHFLQDKDECIVQKTKKYLHNKEKDYK